MLVDGVPRRSIEVAADGWSVDVVDQTRLPFAFEHKNLRTLDDAAQAIRDMVVRGAPLIGATAAYGLYLALRENPGDADMRAACATLSATRPTAVNLRWALARMRAGLEQIDPGHRAGRAFAIAGEICSEDVETNRAIGRHGLDLIRDIARAKSGEPVNILTHCNAGWLATVDWGTATAPVYTAHAEGIPLHVWVDETRPRNQGGLTAWELGQQGVPHTYIVDNAGGHLMQHGRVDLCLVGSDRTTRAGDVGNKIGTYLKALAAKDNGVPFYVCLPSSTIDWEIGDGLSGIPIERRDTDEVALIRGRDRQGEIETVSILPGGSGCDNHAFDVTPARLVSGLVTERGIFAASEHALAALRPA